MEPEEENGLDSEESEDEDYIPNAEPSENIPVSEEEDDGDPEEKTDKKSQKRKRGSGVVNPKAKRRRRRNGEDEDSDDDSDDQDFTPDNDKDLEDDTDETEPEDVETVARRELAEKERTDRLWQDFLTDVETTKAKRKEEKETGIKSTVEKVVTKIYDFAGQHVRVEEKVRIEQPKSSAASSSNGASTTVSENQDVSTPSGSENGNSEEGDSPTKKIRKYRISFLSGNPAEIGLAGGKGVSAKEGLANVLNALHAKNKKIGTLEKSKLDWEAYKRDQNIDEELSLHNRSKHGFIDKQEFLQRADVRQFEIEKAARTKTRKPI